MKNRLLKSDKYKKARGGCSRLLEISCEKCSAKLCLYQKDGPGILKRMYLDRMIDPTVAINAKELLCPECHRLLGTLMIYKKEDRPAYRLFVGAVKKTLA